MGSQLIAAMLVILFFLLYKEHKSGQRKFAETLRNELDKLRSEMQVRDTGSGVIGARSNTGQDRFDARDAQTRSPMDEKVPV